MELRRHAASLVIAVVDLNYLISQSGLAYSIAFEVLWYSRLRPVANQLALFPTPALVPRWRCEFFAGRSWLERGGPWP